MSKSQSQLYPYPLIRICQFVLSLYCLFMPIELAAAPSRRTHLSFMLKSLTANAGGQDAYAVKYEAENREFSLFSNQNLLLDGKPYSGITYGVSFDACEKDCWARLFTSVAGGISNAGPLAQVSVGFSVPLIPIVLPMDAPLYVPQLRVEVTNQFQAVQWYVLQWSYPLWVGVSFPL